MKINVLHDKLYDMLKIVDKICRKNQITYWLHGGSAIGAVREHDFIPWDDDMDILILAEDYLKFKEAMKRDLSEPLKIIEPQDFSPYFYDYVIRIVDHKSSLREPTETDAAYHNYQNNVCIDVFLLSGCPKLGLRQRIWFLNYDIIYGMAMGYRYDIDYSKYNFIQKCEVAILRCLGKLASGKKPDRIIKYWNKFTLSCDASKTGMRMVSNTMLHCYWKPMPDEWFKGTVLMPFRDMCVPVPEEYDKLLRFIYGDYMTPVRDTDKYLTHLSPEDLENIDA